MKSIWPKSVCLSGCLFVSPSVVYLLVSHFVLNVSELIISIFFFDIPCIRRMYTSTVRNGTDCLMKETGNHSRSWQSYLCFYSFYDKFKEMWPLRQWRVASKQRTSIHYEHMKYIKRQMWLHLFGRSQIWTLAPLWIIVELQTLTMKIVWKDDRSRAMKT